MISGRLSAFAIGVAVLAFAMGAWAQSIVSAKSGAIHHVEGQAFIDDKEIQIKATEFPNLQEGSVLRTELGRVEMLLTPGVIVRLGEHSAVRMVANRLSDTRIEVLDGSALIEAMEILQDNAVTFHYKDATIQVLKEGLYRIDSDSSELRVYDGRAEVTAGGKTLTAKKGRLVELGEPVLAAAKFDSKTGDSLYRWSYRRSGYLAMANLSAAKSISDWQTPWYSRGGWYWNPYFGMFTFIPGSGVFYSPFGFSYWSPMDVYYAYAPQYRPNWGGSRGGSGGMGTFNPDRGYVTVGGRSAGGGLSSAPSTSAPSAAPAASPRTSSGAASRGDAGGGRGR
ncbi:MAG: hypothetical protein KIT09_05735 [Bryobacteraceae bacterium]|nr:hypothetical protein [Bryobacteraceae bacterium]